MGGVPPLPKGKEKEKEKIPQLWREPKRALLLCELPVLQSCCGFEVTSATLMESLVSHSCSDAPVMRRGLGSQVRIPADSRRSPAAAWRLGPLWGHKGAAPRGGVVCPVPGHLLAKQDEPT